MTYQLPNRNCKINLDNVTHIKILFNEDPWYKLIHKKGDAKRHIMFTKPRYYQENMYQTMFGDVYKESELRDDHIFTTDGKMYELPVVAIYLMDSQTIKVTCKTYEEAEELYNDIGEKLNSNKSNQELIEIA